MTRAPSDVGCEAPVPDAVRQLASRYDADARTYRTAWGPVLLPAGRRLLGDFAGLRVRVALDVGAGVGALTRELARRFPGATVLALDRSPGMLALGPDDAHRAVMDARRLGVASGCADLAIAAFVLFLLQRPEEALVEMLRALRPGGRLGAITWQSSMESKAIELWNDGLDEVAPPLPAPAYAGGDVTDSPGKMVALLERCGFESARARTEELAWRFAPDELLTLRTGMGVWRRRFQQLEPRERRRLQARMRARFERLPPEAFVARAQLVFATGTAPRGRASTHRGRASTHRGRASAPRGRASAPRGW